MSVLVLGQNSPSGRQVRASSYQLLLQGDLLQLHLVDASLGGANECRSGDQGALHIGRRLEIGDGFWLGGDG